MDWGGGGKGKKAFCLFLLMQALECGRMRPPGDCSPDVFVTFGCIPFGPRKRGSPWEVSGADFNCGWYYCLLSQILENRWSVPQHTLRQGLCSCWKSRLKTFSNLRNAVSNFSACPKHRVLYPFGLFFHLCQVFTANLPDPHTPLRLGSRLPAATPPAGDSARNDSPSLSLTVEKPPHFQSFFWNAASSVKPYVSPNNCNESFSLLPREFLFLISHRVLFCHIFPMCFPYCIVRSLKTAPIWPLSVYPTSPLVPSSLWEFVEFWGCFFHWACDFQLSRTGWHSNAWAFHAGGLKWNPGPTT